MMKFQPYCRTNKLRILSDKLGWFEAYKNYNSKNNLQPKRLTKIQIADYESLPSLTKEQRYEQNNLFMENFRAEQDTQISDTSSVYQLKMLIDGIQQREKDKDILQINQSLTIDGSFIKDEELEEINVSIIQGPFIPHLIKVEEQPTMESNYTQSKSTSQFPESVQKKKKKIKTISYEYEITLYKRYHDQYMARINDLPKKSSQQAQKTGIIIKDESLFDFDFSKAWQ